MCTSWSSANQISNFKFSAFFRVLFALWSLKYPHPKSQQTPWVSTELEMVVNLSYSFIPLQKLSQKGVDRSVENPQKCAEPYTVPIARRAEQIYLAHQNYLLLPRIWLACAEPYTVPIARRGIKMPFCFTGYDWPKRPKFLRQRTKKSWVDQFFGWVPYISGNVSSSAWKNILFIWVKFPQKPYFHKNDLKV